MCRQHCCVLDSHRPLFISKFKQVIRSCSRQHRKRPESTRPLAVAERHIHASQHRPAWIEVDSATPLHRDRPSPFQSARAATAPQADSNSTAQLPQASALPSLGRGAPAPQRTARRATGLPRTRCSRAPTAPHRTPGARRTTTANQPPRATPRPPLRGGTERGSRRARSPATQALSQRTSDRRERLSWRGAQRAARAIGGWGFLGMPSGGADNDGRAYLKAHPTSGFRQISNDHLNEA